MLAAVPLMIVPLIAYNVLIFSPVGGGPQVLDTEVLNVAMLSGAEWTMQVSDVVIVAALLLLFIEVLKATRTASWSLIDHLLSALVFVAFLVEFLLIAQAATDLFFILTVIAFVDLIAGFSVAIRSAGRDVSIGL